MLSKCFHQREISFFKGATRLEHICRLDYIGLTTTLDQVSERDVIFDKCETQVLHIILLAFSGGSKSC